MNKPLAACLRSLVLLSAWALGVLSVALPADAQQTYYIYADHLDTPRQIENQSQQVVWRWDNDDPFGGNIANANPSGLGTFEFNLRFPGQYFDKETNLHYNYFRDYSPEIGRYIESDPIGLRGGPNTYAYVGSNAMSFIDSRGLAIECRYVVGGYYDRTVTDKIPATGEWVVECVAKPKPGIGIPDPIDRTRRRGRVLPNPADINVEMECRDSWRESRPEQLITTTQHWLWGWQECIDTCTGKVVSKTWVPDRPAN